MTNREKLNSMALYDLLCRMQKNFDEGALCILEFITGSKVPCIQNKPFPPCEECIANWLNSKYDGRL